MQTSFYILCAETVPENYTWDRGTPLAPSNAATTVLVPDSTTTYVSGYAPGVRVVFQNNSIPETGYDNITYNWDFGDYYNDTNNFASLSCISSIDHYYVMPGTYRVTLSLVQTKTETTNDTANDLLCKGKYGFRWFWNDLNQGDQNAKTWNETKIDAAYPKQWYEETACLQKYCTSWSWDQLQSDNIDIEKRIQWGQTQTGSAFEKKWMYEANDTLCTIENYTTQDTVSKLEQTITTTEIVVKEKPPTAGMYSMTRPITGYTPYTVRLTPRTTLCGSFPIDRIDWDFGDGSPIKTITRYAPTYDDPTIISNVLEGLAFPDDRDDVRNFDVLHTYTVNNNTYPVFYPSLTCYSASTNTSDSCCITIGPITLSSQPLETHLLKARNTLKGNIYAFNVGENIAFTTTTLTTAQTTPVIYNIPTTKLRDTYDRFIIGEYNGNPGIGYPPEYTITCGARSEELTTFIATESATSTTSLGMISSVPINTESELTFIP